jgi:hypothetical protein
MQLTGPSAVSFVADVPTIKVTSITVDMSTGNYTIYYSDSTGTVTRTATGALLPATYAAIQATSKTIVEAAVGWAPGSSAASP